MEYLWSIFGQTPTKTLQPLSSAFSMQELIDWDPKTDPNAKFNVVTLKIQERVSNTQAKLVGLFGQITSNQPSQGTKEFNVFVNTFWQYLDIFVYWAGSASEGIVVPPAPYWVEAGHKNGVKVYGNVFFPSVNDGGNIQWVKQLVAQTDGLFKGADQLILVAKTYGFDGWFINQETTGGDVELANNMIAFLQYIRMNSDIDIMWYDAMDAQGEVNYQNQFNNENSPFLSNNKILGANTIFLNYWWDEVMIAESATHADSLSLNPMCVFAGINTYQEQMNTCNLIANVYSKNGSCPYTSIGMFLPNWTYKGIPNITYDEFVQRDADFWQSISEYHKPLTVINTMPFVTHFNRGQGQAYFIDGHKVQDRNWNDIWQQELLPTNRFSNVLDCTFNYETAYNGGCSYVIGSTGTVDNYTHWLYDMNININGDNCFLITYKTIGTSTLFLTIRFVGGVEIFYMQPNENWGTLQIPISTKQTVLGMGIRVTDANNFNLYIGRMGLIADENRIPKAPTNGRVMSKLAHYRKTELVMEWDKTEYASAYYIFNEDHFVCKSMKPIRWLEIETNYSDTNLYVCGVSDIGICGDKAKIVVK